MGRKRSKHRRSSGGGGGMMSSMRGGFRNVAKGAVGKSTSRRAQMFWSVLTWAAVAVAVGVVLHRCGVV